MISTHHEPLVLGGVELGGTTIRIVVAHNHPTNLIYSKIINTTTPDESLSQCIAILRDQSIDCLGIGSFGPIQLDKTKSNYGSITSTPKTSWQDAQIVDRFNSFNVPIGFTTDVNSAALGMYM